MCCRNFCESGNGGLTDDAGSQLEIMSRFISESLFRSRHMFYRKSMLSFPFPKNRKRYSPAQISVNFSRKNKHKKTQPKVYLKTKVKVFYKANRKSAKKYS
jgi:hypothetical protein